MTGHPPGVIYQTDGKIVSLEIADYVALKQAGLIGRDVPETARLQIVFDDDRSLFFKPRQRFFQNCWMETQLILDTVQSPLDLVDELLFGVREAWNLDEILPIIGRDAYKRLCTIGLEYYDNLANNRYIPAVGSPLSAWSGSLLGTGGSGCRIREGRTIKEITPVIPWP